MRLTDDRYEHERRQLELAMRMIQLEARTYIIRTCTGLSEDRVRKLYRTYVLSTRNRRPLQRRRGKSPHRSDILLRNARTHQQASLLAGALASLDLLQRRPGGATRQLDAITGNMLCDAYEMYASLLADEPLSFEHAWLLWRELTRAGDLFVKPCRDCNSLNLQDRLAVRARPCPWCGTKDF